MDTKPNIQHSETESAARICANAFRVPVYVLWNSRTGKFSHGSRNWAMLKLDRAEYSIHSIIEPATFHE